MLLSAKGGLVIPSSAEEVVHGVPLHPDPLDSAGMKIDPQSEALPVRIPAGLVGVEGPLVTESGERSDGAVLSSSTSTTRPSPFRLERARRPRKSSR